MELMNDYEQILEIVRQWSADQRLLLLRDISQTLAPNRKPLRPPRDTLSKALGLLSTGTIPHCDEEVKSCLS